VKRALDLFGAAAGLVLAAPVFAAVAIALRLGGQDVFFRQPRVGAGLRLFEVVKFTTMPKGAERLGRLCAADDRRPTRLGRFLRRTKLNELPQLLNVLRGEMSLVGPRPLFEEQVARYPAEVREAIGALRPGLTGLGSLFFSAEDELLAAVEDRERFYDEVILPQKGALELFYGRQRSLWLDLQILALTAASLALRRPCLPRRARPLVQGFASGASSRRRSRSRRA
jgi:lipopolysaccharide/colanic/teichoic acid biosynthesis glycosyltransferase